MIISIWLTAVIIQMVITIILSSQFARHGSLSKKSKTTFSIVIAARNEEENLAALLPKLVTQEHPEFEVIVALDRCSDGSLEVIGQFNQVKVAVIKAVPDGLDPKKYALTTAISQATGDWIAFLDADCIPESTHWLSKIESEVTEQLHILIGYSPFQKGKSLLDHFSQYEAFITAFNYLAMALAGHPYMAVGRNLAIRRSFFEASGGYTEFQKITGGDDDLFIQKNATKSNTHVFMGTEAMVYTKPKDTWDQYFIQKTRHLSVGGKYSNKDQLLHLLFNGSLFATWILLPLLSIEFILPIILFYLSVKGIGYRFAHSKMGAGFNYILLPLVDLMYAIILPIIAIRSKLVKDIRWKN